MVLKTTNNYTVRLSKDSIVRRVFDEMNGGINYHIEHHIFPSLEWHQLREISPVVEKFCQENGLEYHSYTVLELVGGQWGRLTGGE